jgi:hypothetical protein
MTEHEIQKHIWENKERWPELIAEFESPKRYDFDSDNNAINNLSPDRVIFNQLIDRYEQTYKQLHGLRLIGCEVSLKKDGDSTIRADFLGMIDGVAGIALIELKKSAQTERQAYTELFGYAAHLHGIFPTMTNDDVIYILISPMKERIVREATIHSFLFDEKPVFAFIPTWTGDDVNTLKLVPWIPTEEDIVHVTDSIFSQHNFEVFKVTWDSVKDWNASSGEDPSSHMVERMNKISAYAAQIMEAKNVHGFVFASQNYPEVAGLPNSIIVVGLNPFKIAKDNFFLKNGASKLDLKDTPESISFLEIVPELESKAKELHQANNYYDDLMTVWNDTITKIALDVVNLMTSNKFNSTVQKGWGSMTWEEYQTNFKEDVLCFNYSLRPTGMLRKLYVAYTKEDFKYIAKFGYKHHPTLHHGDVQPYMADYLDNQQNFRDFLHRLFDINFQSRE